VKRFAVEAALVLAVFAGVQLFQARNLPSGPAPVTSGPGLAGEVRSLEALRGRAAVVHFWATWCGVCRAEEGTVADLAKSRPMLTVASSSGEAEEVRRYLSERGLELPVLVDEDGTLARAWKVGAYPTSFFVDANGTIRATAVGYTTKIGFLARLWWAGRF
jgi:thiol-disulfide isomerase/thioredoxin